MNVEDLFNISKEERKDFPLTASLIDELIKFGEDAHFDERGELLECLEAYMEGFSDFSIEFYIRKVMLGEFEIPLPNEFSGWSEEDLDILHNRYKILKKLNKLTK